MGILKDAIIGFLNAQESDRDPKHLGISSLGHCGRQLSYRVHGTKGTDHSWQTKAKFDDGNLAQDQLRHWIRKGLIANKECYRLVGEEREVKLPIGTEHSMTGHVDGILEHYPRRCSNPNHKDLLLEIKTMNPTGFRFYKKDGVSFEYLCQVNGYLAGAGLTEAKVLVKEKGDFYVDDSQTITLDPELVSRRLSVVHSALVSKEPAQVAKEYGPDSKGKLPWQCNYCPFLKTCWKDSEPIEYEPNKYKLTKNV